MESDDEAEETSNGWAILGGIAGWVWVAVAIWGFIEHGKRFWPTFIVGCLVIGLIAWIASLYEDDEGSGG